MARKDSGLIALVLLGGGLIASVAYAYRGGFKYDDQISKSFAVSEFLRSIYIPELSKYRLTRAEHGNLSLLVTQILQPMRNRFGRVVVTGGGRPGAVAKARGTTWYAVLSKSGHVPAKKSDHPSFGAADVRVPGADPFDVWQWLQLSPHIRQAIVDIGADGEIYFHVSVVTPKRKKVSASRRFLNLTGSVLP